MNTSHLCFRCLRTRLPSCLLVPPFAQVMSRMPWQNRDPAEFGLSRTLARSWSCYLPSCACLRCCLPSRVKEPDCVLTPGAELLFLSPSYISFTRFLPPYLASLSPHQPPRTTNPLELQALLHHLLLRRFICLHCKTIYDFRVFGCLGSRLL